MLHWLGTILILCGGLLTRQTLLCGERRAQRTRRALADALEAMEAEIRALLTPMPQLLRRRYDESVEGFFDGVTRAISRGAPLAEAWRRATETLPLPPEERESVAALGGRLGGGEESVCAALSLTAAALRRSYDRAEAQRRDRERLTTSLCLSASLLLAVLLL